MKVYARRVNSVETIHESSIPSFEEKTLIRLSGDGRTSAPLNTPNGILPGGESRIEILSGFASQSYFHLPPPLIADEYHPIRYVFLKLRRPLVIATPLSNPAVIITVHLEMPGTPDFSVETDERGVTWDIDGDNGEWSQQGLEPAGLTYLTLVFNSWLPSGHPAPNVDFSWELLGEMRVLSKRTLGH